MDNQASNSLEAFGFLTILEDESHGLFGGYLVLSARGRPLEFRCSTPVQATRAQEILYGPTLRSYLLAEVIGQALIDSAQTPVRAVLTDEIEMLELALYRSEEVFWVAPTSDSTVPDDAPTTNPASTTPTHPIEGSPPPGSAGAWIEVVGRRMRLASTSGCRPDQALELLAPLVAHVDPSEPFERVRVALREAGQIPENPRGIDEAHAAAA